MNQIHNQIRIRASDSHGASTSTRSKLPISHFIRPSFEKQQWSRPNLAVKAAQGGPNSDPSAAEPSYPPTTRLARALRSVPRRINVYFRGRWDRQAVWCFISFGSGYYVANSISLSFGALAINDVVAAAIMVTFYELISYYYFTANKLSLRLLFLNWAKMGVVAGFIADALKLGG